MDWISAYMQGEPAALPRGYAIEFGTGRVVPVQRPPRPAGRPVRKGG